VAEEGCTSLLSLARQCTNGSGRFHALLRQSAGQVHRHEQQRISGGRRTGRTSSHGTQGQFHCTQYGAYALIREHRRLCGFRHHGRHLGNRRLLCSDRQGVLEPLQAAPTIIEDDCFIGARSEVVEGVIVEKGSVISMGVYIGQSTRIYDREKDEVSYGRIPAGSVVVSGNLPSDNGKYSLYCAVIVKRVDEKTRSKVGINELLRIVD